MLKIRMERHLNSCFHREDTRTFDTFAELEEWIFDQMQQDYTGYKMTLRFPTSEIAQCFHDDGPCRIEIHPTPDGEQLWIHQIETPEGIIFSDGRYTAGKKFWTQEVQTWLTHCEQRRLNPQFNFVGGDEPPKRKLWARLGVSIYITAEEEATIFGGNEETTARTIRKIIAEGRFVPDGDSYVPEQTVEQFNNDYGTSYPTQDINFNV
jgi:hypothetical protein